MKRMHLPQRLGWLRKWRRILVFYITLPLLGLTLIGWFFILPIAACQIARDVVNAEINGRFDVSWASFGPQRVSLFNAKLFDRSGNRIAHAKEVVVLFDRPFWFGKPTVQAIHLERADLTLTMAPGGRWDLQDVLAKEQQEDPNKKAKVRTLERVTVDDGRLELRTKAARAVFGQLFAHITVEQNRFTLERVEASCCSGRASLGGWFGTGDNHNWTLQFNMQGLAVTELARGTALEDRKLSGKLDGFLTLDRKGETEPLGAGWFDVTRGQLYEVPVLLSIFNVLRLRSPGETYIDTTRCDFEVRPDRVHVQRLQFISKGLSLHGNGDIFFEGEKVCLDFVPTLGLKVPDELEDIPPVEEVGKFGDFVKRNFLVCIEVRGTWTKPESSVVPLRVITGPLRAFWKMLKGSEGSGE